MKNYIKRFFRKIFLSLKQSKNELTFYRATLFFYQSTIVKYQL